MKYASDRRQSGATLLVSLIMLVVLTLFVITGFNLSSVNLRIAGNFQQQKAMEAAALEAMEQVISIRHAFHSASAAQDVPVTGGFSVRVNAPACVYWTTADGFSDAALGAGGVPTAAPWETDWVVSAVVTDTLFGAKATIVQGLRIRRFAGNCP